MSCSVECIVAIYTVPKLVAVIQAISVAAMEQATASEDLIQVEHEKEMTDCVGKKISVDLVLKNAHGDRIGVRSLPAINGQEQPLEFVFENSNSSKAKQTVDRIRQAYARLQIINELKQKGYQNVKEEKLPNGSIRLVVQKWR